MADPSPNNASVPLVSADTSGSEPAHAFRTYASDVAALTGKPLAKDVKNEAAPPKPPLPAPEPPPAKIIPKAPSTDESREHVLARLKQRALPKEPPPQQAESIAPAPKAPSTNESKEEVLARLRAKAAAPKPPEPPPVIERPAPPPPASEVKPVAEAGPSPLHTYKTDFAEHTAAQGASRIAMVAAQQDAGASPAPTVLKEKPKGRALVFVAGTLLIIAGVGSIYAAYRFATGQPPVPPELFVPSIIFADERAELSGEGSDLRVAFTELMNQPLSDGKVLIAYMTRATTTADGTVIMQPAEGGALVAALGLPAPDILLRNVGPESVAGILNAGGDTRPFFILRVGSFERTFAGMLEWEGTMERDLGQFYPPHPEVAVPIASSTASSTPTAASADTAPFRLGFVDEVVANRDVRVLRDRDNRVVMLYGYRDKKTLIIARNEAAFMELLERLAASRAQ